MKIRGTDFVLLEVSDLKTAARFYRDVLGLKQEIFSEEYGWAEFNCGNVTLALKGGATLVGGGTGARVALAVDDVAAAYEELRHKRVPIVCQPEDHVVCQHVDVLDPDGNVIILHHRADGTFGPSSPTTPSRDKAQPLRQVGPALRS